MVIMTILTIAVYFNYKLKHVGIQNNLFPNNSKKFVSK